MNTQPTSPEISNLSPSALDELKRLAQLPDDDENKLLLKKILGFDGRETRKTNSLSQPYYKKEYALKIIPTLERIDRDRKHVYIDATKFPTSSLNTIHAKVRQSIQYLTDNLDPEGKYNRIRKLFEIKTKGNKLIFFYVGADDTFDFPLEDLKESSSFDDVKKEIDNFIENGTKGTKLDLPHEGDRRIGIREFLPFYLKDNEVVMLRELCQPATEFGLVYDIDNETVFLGKSG